MRYNVPEEEKPAFNKQTQKGLVLLTQGISDTLGRVKSLQPQTLVDAYNQPVQAPVTRNLTPLEQYVYEPQPVPEVGSLTEMPARESMVVPQEQSQVLSNFRNQAEAQFSRDMVSITPYEQAVTDVIGAEVDSLRNDSGEIASSPLEVFSKPLDANKVKALGFVDAEGNPTETGELFFNLKNSGMFNEDGTITEKGQAYLIPRSELKKPENNRAFKVWYDDQLDETPAADGEIMGAVFGFGKNLFTGAFNLLQTANKLTSVSGLYNIAKQTAAGKETIAELKTDQIAALEQVAKNFQNVGGYADIIQGLTGRLLYEGASAATGVPMEQMKAAAEENLYLARQRQWAANENLRDLEVGTIAEAMTGIDGIVNMAREARDTLGEEKFKQRYTGTSAVVEMSGDPANLMPAAKAFNVATSAPIASRAIIKAQQILGKTAQIEKALNEAQTIVEAGNTILKKEAVAVPLAQKLFTDISARAGANPELLARAQQASDAAKRIVSSADEVRAAMPGAMASVEQLAAKRASLATRIPEEYAKKVVQTAELGAKVRAMPANVASSILERTGNTLTKVDDAVTGYLSERGLDQAYNAALGASGVVGLAGNPVVGAIGLGAAALKTGKFLTEYGKTLRYVGKEMANARGQIPFWKRVHAHTAPGSLGKGLSHTFNIFELGGATSDILRRTGRGIVAAYPSDLFFEYLSDGGEMRPQTMTRAAAESFVLGGAFAAGGGAFMGTQQRMRELAIGDEINFRQGLVDTDQKARFEALPPVIKRSMATYSMANPTLNYNFIESGSSGYDPSSNTANININSTNPLKALVAHETLHHTIIKNNMEGGIAAMFLGDTKTNSAGGLFRSKDGKLDPEFEAFTNGYYDRLRAGGMSDAEIKTEYPLDKVAVEYFIEQHSEQYAQMAESGELGALAAKGLVRQKLSSALETILPKIPVLRDLHLKSGGAIDANGAFVTGVGILGDFGVSQNPIAKKMFREMNRRSTGMMPGQFEPLMGDKEGSGAPLFFDPTNEIDMELMHPLIQVDANDKPILKDGRPIAIAKEVDLNRTIAGLTIAEAYRKLRDNNYAPEKGEAYIDDDGTLQPGWISDNVLNQMFAKHQFNNEQKRMIRQTNKMVKEGTGQRMVMINFPATTRNKAGKVVYKTQGATIRDTVPVAITIGKDGQVLYGLMSVTKLQENIKKRAQSRRGKKLYSGNIDLILRDVHAMMDFHKKGEDSINWFTEKYGVVEADQRKKFINTMFGLLNKKEQAVLNPMLLEDGIKSSDNVYRTYRADRVSKAIPMSPEEYAAMPFSYEAVSAVRMPEQRQMPEVAVVPERFTGSKEDVDRRGKYVEPPGFFKRFNIDSYERGGRFFDAANGEDLTGKQYSTGSIDVSTGKPRLFVDNISDVTKSGAKFKTNLFKQSAGWKWTSENPPSTSTIVSVEGQGKHVYSLKANFESGVELARYSEKKSEPRLRPTAYGELKLGNQVGEISIRGKLHPVYDSIGVTSKAQGSRLMPEVSPEDLNPVANKQEAQGLWADGKRMFALNEMDEKLTPITSKAMLDSYSADAIGWMEPEQATAPSQRFMPEKLDADYMKAVESGDVGEQQRLVDEAAMKAGYDVENISYHGTNIDFNNFDVSDKIGVWTGSESVASLFSRIKSAREGGTPRLIKAYLRTNNTAPAEYDVSLAGDKAVKQREDLIAKGFDSIESKGNFKIVFSPEQIKSADPITRDDSGNIIPLSKRFDITSKDLRFMPEGYKSHHDETLLNSAWNGSELDLNRPFKASESLPSLAMRTKWEEKPLVNKGDFDFKQKARVVFGKNKNGEDVTFKFDPNLLNTPSIVDFSKVYSGEQIQYTIADRMSSVDGDMGGSLHPFLKNNDIVIEGPDGRKYVVGWGNNSATVGTKMRRKAKDGAKVLMVYLMGKEAHESNTRTVRLFDTQLENSSMPSHMADIARAYSYIPIKEIKHSSSLKEVERIDGLLKKAKTAKKGSDYISKLKSDKNLAIKEAQKFKVSAYEIELAGIFRKVKSSQTRLNNGLGKQSTVDANIKELINFATSAKGKKLIGEIPSQFIYEMTGTFDGRKSAVSQISNLKLYDFDGSALSAATADMETGDKNAIVTAIDLSDNQDFFMLYMGDDPKQMNAMTESEKSAAAKLKKNSNFVIHEAYDTLILSPLNGRRNLNSRMENALDAVPDSFQAVLDDRPSVKAQVGKTDAKGRLILSEDNLLNTVRDQQTVPLIYNPRK